MGVYQNQRTLCGAVKVAVDGTTMMMTMQWGGRGDLEVVVTMRVRIGGDDKHGGVACVDWSSGKRLAESGDDVKKKRVRDGGARCEGGVVEMEMKVVVVWQRGDNNSEVVVVIRRIYVTPSHTKKIFDNMRRVGKDFSGRVTPLFPRMMVQAQEEIGEDEAVNEEMDDSLERATTTATSLDVEQDMGNIAKTQFKATPNESSSQRTDLGCGPRCQEAMRDTSAHTRYERVSKIFNDPLLKVLDLEDELKRKKTAQQTKIDSLERRVKNLKKKQRSRTYKLKRLYKVSLTARVISSSNDEALDKEDTSKQERIDETDANEDITLVSVAATTVTIDDIILAKALVDIKTSKPKIRGIVIKDHEEPSESRTTTISSKKSQDKGKAKMIKDAMKLKKKDQILFNEEAKLDANYQLAKKMQAEEEQELNEEEKAKLCMELLKKRRKFFAAKRAEEKRNIPPTKAQQRSLMYTYLKNMDGWKPKALKNKSFTEIQELFYKSMKKKNNFIDIRTELKIVDDKEATNLKQLVKIIPEEDIEINAIPLVVKTPIVDWKIYKERKKSYYQIIRACGKSKNYLVFSHMLKDFDREDVEALWRMVKAKYGSTRPEEDYDRVFWGDLKVMFDPHVEDEVWKLQQSYKVEKWTLFNCCGVHCLSL
uniref:Uncharacterized protein n=1 Tax=Tanacetum cinerariifolium TaxID=118510 RepID=A0A6L2P5U6_TANCI|nr:hypothetical protein [Tanacetum cinerariifolium]